MSVETVRSYPGSFIGGDEHANAGAVDVVDSLQVQDQ